VEKELAEAMALPKTLAWGEIGLDYHYNLSDPEKQKEVFARQLQMAVQLGKPLVIHTREAEDGTLCSTSHPPPPLCGFHLADTTLGAHTDTLKLMKEHVPKGWRVHVHCFTSSLDMAKSLLADWPNLFIGYTGVRDARSLLASPRTPD
jgi:TatD DNase family protein